MPVYNEPGRGGVRRLVAPDPAYDWSPSGRRDRAGVWGTAFVRRFESIRSFSYTYMAHRNRVRRPLSIVREAAFIRENADRWERFETLLREGSADSEELADLYVALTDDLAYARTHFPDGDTVSYLNKLASEVHQAVYRERREKRSRIWHFFSVEVPRAVGRAQMELVAALLVFALAVGIGALSATYDDGFTRLILGDAYVNMTLENIEQGTPLAVYKQAHSVDMFLGIAVNNVRVAFRTFAMGLIFSVGSAYMLLQNGIMIGAFHALFAENHVLGESLTGVYIHGTLEISAIIVAGAAGFVLGNGLLWPGTFPRRQAFVRAARQGSKIAVGLVPVFGMAAFLEGFVTRYTSMPVALSLGVIGASLSFVVWYFGVRPHQLQKTFE